MTDCLEGVQESVYFLCLFFLDSCINFAKWIDLNHTHKEKVFLEKAWNVIPRLETEINGLAVPK